MTVYDQVLLYLRTSNNKKLSAGVHPRLREYTRLLLFAEKFKMNKFDLMNCTSEWVDEIEQVHYAVEKYKNEQIKSVSNERAQKPSFSPKGGTRIVTEKLM